jgi:hypothetical protein
MGVTAPIVRILCAEGTSDVMLGMACWALSNLNADGPTPAIQKAPLSVPTNPHVDPDLLWYQELENGRLLSALKRIVVEEKENTDVMEKVLWLLTNITT